MSLVVICASNAINIFSGTVYGTIYSKEHTEQTIESFSNEYYYYEQQLLDYYTQEWYEQ